MRFYLACAAVFVIGLLGSFVYAQIPSAGRAERAAENIGLTNVRVESRGLAWGALGGCKDSDLTKFRVSGTDAHGVRRQIEVCAPLIGGYTIRN